MRAKSIDLFAGAGGLSVGLEKAGFEVVFANDIGADMCESYKLNHPLTFVQRQDITNITGKGILKLIGLRADKIDVLVGGPPCQGFSTVGKKDECDDRNKLFVHYFRIVAEIKPKVVVFENVPGFKRLYSGRAFDAVCKEFKKLGYEAEARILNALNYGVPQNRERTFIVGYEKGLAFSWPKATHGYNNLLFEDPLSKPLTLGDAIGDLPVVGPSEKADDYISEPKNNFQRERRKGCQRLTEQIGPKHGPKLIKLMGLVPPGGSILDVPAQYRPKSCFANTYARLWWDKPATTITRNFGTPSSSRCIHPFANRGLTTREGARLQSFDDDYIFIGNRTSKNLQIGNAIPPLLAEAICRKVYESLK